MQSHAEGSATDETARIQSYCDITATVGERIECNMEDKDASFKCV